MSIYGNTSQFSFKLCINLECNQTQLPCNFIAQKLYNLVKSSPLKCKFLRLLSSWVKIRQIPFVNFETVSQSLLRFFSFFSVVTYNSSVSLSLMHFLLWAKGSHENTNFNIFKCSDENLPNSSCHFPNLKSFFLQILNDSSASWNILLSTFLGQALYTLHKKDQNANFFRLFSARFKIHQIYVIFETKNKFLFKFCTILWYHEA